MRHDLSQSPKVFKGDPWGVNVEFRWVKGLSHFLVNVFNHF